jgi:hypothetical protein
MNGRSSFLGVLVSLAFLCPAHGQPCTGMNTAKHMNADYNFNYESWVKKSDSGKSFVFGRCVQTNNDKDLYVD